MAQHQFPLEPVTQFAGANASIRRPREITCFSYDEDHKYRSDASSLRYYYPPVLPADLNKGFDTFRQLDDTGDDHLDGLLQAIEDHERRTGKKVDAHFVTWRGMMTKIMVAAFNRQDGWEMNATLFDETLFMEENHAKKLSSRQEQYSAPSRPGNMSQDLMSFWGYKMETLSLLAETWAATSRATIENRENETVSNYAQYCSVVRTGFGKTKLIIGGEVDAVLDYKPDDNSLPVNWVELKTTKEIYNDRDQTTFERKLLKFWAQSFLLGVPKIVVGFRTQQGVLERLEELDVQTIPDKVLQQGKRLWDGNVCISATATFLDWLKTTITGEGVWRIRKPEKIPVIEVFKMEETGTGDILSSNFIHWRQFGLPTVLSQQAQVPEKAAIPDNKINSPVDAVEVTPI